MSEAAAIEISELRKVYRDGLIFRRSFEALRGISFSVEPGEIFGLLGPNGAGKTTFIKVLLGIVRKSGGTATVLGHSAGNRRTRRRIGYLPENLRIPRHLNACSALDYYGGLSGLSVADARARRGQLLESVGLAEWTKVTVKKYSKGMLQRLGLAQALLHDPELLFLDEPTDGLDPIGRSHVRNVLRDLKAAGKTVFLNSHLLQEVEMICDRVAILDKGVLRSVGSLAEIAPKQLEGVELELELTGTVDAVEKVMSQQSVSKRERLGESHFRLVVRLPDQAAVDRCIDDLRREQVSIVGLSRRRITLEDAFLEILGQATESK
jgi:ABC-2 type transport system ATP-binding protein